MKDYRYDLKKGNKKHPCPDCRKKTFVRYFDTKTGELLPEQYGRCDRESKCSHHLNPYKDGYSKAVFEKERGGYTSNWKPQRPTPRTKPAPKAETVFIPFDVFAQTRQGYEQNVFIQNLLSRVPFPFEVKDIEQVISQYNLGTVCNGYRKGAITFPFIDKAANIRTVQVKQFNETNHTIGTDFLHSIIEKHLTKRNEPLPGWLEAYKRNEKTVSCLFGEHLLNRYPLNPVAIVEAPKTAVYGTLYFGFPEQPENLLWLAVYNLSSLSLEKCKALQGRDVVLFPDLSKDGKAFELWSSKANEFSNRLPDTQFKVSDLLETLAPTELRQYGADIADVLIKQDWRKFRIAEVIQEQHHSITDPVPVPKSEKGENSEALKQTYFFKPETHTPPIENSFQFANHPFNKANIFSKYKAPKPENWERDIIELENYFTGIELPTQPVKLNRASTITNCSLFIESHFATVKAYNGKRTFLPYLHRLHELKQILTTDKNAVTIV